MKITLSDEVIRAISLALAVVTTGGMSAESRAKRFESYIRGGGEDADVPDPIETEEIR